jgi:hypothetical protein
VKVGIFTTALHLIPFYIPVAMVIRFWDVAKNVIKASMKTA